VANSLELLKPRVIAAAQASSAAVAGRTEADPVVVVAPSKASIAAAAPLTARASAAARAAAAVAVAAGRVVAADLAEAAEDEGKQVWSDEGRVEEGFRFQCSGFGPDT